MISLEIHPYSVDASREKTQAALASTVTGGGVRDVASDVSDFSWFDGVAAPWHGIQFSLRGPSYTRPVNIGDHVVLRLAPNAPAVAWGIVVDVRTKVNVRPDGTLSKNTWSVSAVGWFDYLSRVDLVVFDSLREVTPGTNQREVDGTVFGNFEDPYVMIRGPLYDEITAIGNSPAFASLTVPTSEKPLPKDGVAGVFEAISNVASLNNVGKALDIFLRTVLRIYLPTSLSGPAAPASNKNGGPSTAAAPTGTVTQPGQLRESIRVIYDPDSAEAYSGAGLSDRAGLPSRQAEPVVGTRPAFQNIANGSSKIGGIIQGTWGADQLLVEMFPSLEDPGTGQDMNASARKFVSRVVGEAATRAGIAASYIPQPVTAPGAPASAGLLPGVAQALGRNPVLLYRIRPWRTQPLLEWVQSLVAYDPGFALLATSIASAIGEVPTVQQVTWDISRAVRLSTSDIYGLDISASDEDVATLFTSQWAGGDTPEMINPFSGLPIFDVATLTFGGRLYTVSWPFAFGNDGLSAPTKSSTTQQVQIVAAQAAQFGLANQRFYSGSVSSRFRPDVRHGEPVAFEFPGQTLIGYCERVQHMVSISESGIATKRTTVTFSRGCWSELNRPYPPPKDIGPTVLERTA